MSRFFDEADAFVFGTETDSQKGLLLPAVQAFTDGDIETQRGLLLPAVQAFLDAEPEATSDVWDIKDHSGGPIYHDGEVMHDIADPIDGYIDIF